MGSERVSDSERWGTMEEIKLREDLDKCLHSWSEVLHADFREYRWCDLCKRRDGRSEGSANWMILTLPWKVLRYLFEMAEIHQDEISKSVKSCEALIKAS